MNDDDEITIHPRGWWKLSRPCYDKPHRCPGWAGGAFKYAKVDHCPDGYITFGMSKEELAALDLSTDEWAKVRYPRPFALGQCTTCDVVVLPFWTRKLSLIWWWRESWWTFENWWWWRRTALQGWWQNRKKKGR